MSDVIHIKNPITGRSIIKNSRTHKNLIRKNILDLEGNDIRNVNVEKKEKEKEKEKEVNEDNKENESEDSESEYSSESENETNTKEEDLEIKMQLLGSFKRILKKMGYNNYDDKLLKKAFNFEYEKF